MQSLWLQKAGNPPHGCKTFCSFSTQTSPQMQEMVLQRLREIVGPRWALWVTYAWTLVT